MTQSPEVSIIVPAYNVGPALLRAAVGSALEQTFENLEVIVVNDCSTDDTMAGLDDFHDTRLKVINLSENEGVSAARNVGTAQAKSQWVCYLDADDRMMPSMVQRLLQIANQTSAQIVSCGFLRRSPGSLMPQFEAEGTVMVESPCEAVERVLYQRHALNNSPCAKLFQRSLCLDQPWLPGRYEDLRTFYRLFLAANKIAWTDEPLYIYTENPNSYMQRFSLQRTVVLDVVQEMVQYMETNLPGLVSAAKDRAMSAAFNILRLMSDNGIENSEIRARCRQMIRSYRCRSMFNPKVRLKNRLAAAASYLLF